MNVPQQGTTPVPIMRAEAASGAEPAAVTSPLSLVSVAAAADAVPLMPALQGRSLRGAMAALASFEVALEVQGRGVVISQSPAPGTAVTPGMTCRLTLAGPSGTSPAGSPAVGR
jgi:hypothetical protein